MMKSIVEEKPVSFKELEQKIFKYVCELGCEITRILLEMYARELAATRDTSQYRDKGKSCQRLLDTNRHRLAVENQMETW